jgi:hypothetical protein
MGAYYKGEQVRGYYQGHLLNAFKDSSKMAVNRIWPFSLRLKSFDMTWEGNQYGSSMSSYANITGGYPPYTITTMTNFSGSLNGHLITCYPLSPNTSSETIEEILTVTDAHGRTVTLTLIQKSNQILAINPEWIIWDWDTYGSSNSVAVNITGGDLPCTISTGTNFSATVNNNIITCYPLSSNMSSETIEEILTVTEANGDMVNLTLIQKKKCIFVIVGNGNIMYTDDGGDIWV